MEKVDDDLCGDDSRGNAREVRGDRGEARKEQLGVELLLRTLAPIAGRRSVPLKRSLLTSLKQWCRRVLFWWKSEK